MHALRVSIVCSLVFAALLTSGLLVERLRPSPVVVIVREAPPNVVVVRDGWPGFCRGYDWRYSSVDFRPWCGYD